MSNNDNVLKPRNKQWQNYTLRPGSLSLFGKLQIGTGGAVDGYTGFTGVRSISRVSTGLYTVNFEDRYYGLAHFCAGVQSANTDGYHVLLVSDSFVDGGEGANATVNQKDGYCQIQVVDSGDAAADPIDCDLWLSFVLRTSSRG